MLMVLSVGMTVNNDADDGDDDDDDDDISDHGHH